MSTAIRSHLSDTLAFLKWQIQKQLSRAYATCLHWWAHPFVFAQVSHHLACCSEYRIDCIVQCIYNCAIEVPIVHTKQCRARKYSSFFSAENYKHSILTTMIMVCMFAKKLGIAQPLSRVSKVMCLNKPAAGLCTGACVWSLLLHKLFHPFPNFSRAKGALQQRTMPN